MGRKCVADIEADGLLDQATRIWCMVFKDIDTQEVFSFGHGEIHRALEFMDGCEVLIMHNGIGYDWPLLKKLEWYEYKGTKIDTLLMSRLQRPDRGTPPGCRKGPHSVEAWGIRFGRHKPEHDDWSQYSPEMMHRCREDVEIQFLIYRALQDEARGENWTNAHRLTHKLFEILQLQEEYGWAVDIEYMKKCLHQLTFWMDRIDRIAIPRLPLRCIDEGPVNKPFLKSGQYSKMAVDWIGDGCVRFGYHTVCGPFTRVSFVPLDTGSNGQIKDYFLSQGWVPKDWNMKDGQRTSPKMNHDEEFIGIEGGLARLLVKRVQCRHRRSQIEGWMGKIREDGRISQKITGIATTGRLIHGVIVNVPGAESFYGKQMRKIFTHKPGYKIVGIDSAGCQNRMLAARAGDPNFTKILLEGNKQDKTSIHYVNMKAIKESSGLEVPYGTCKNLNYAFMFGARDPKLAQTAGVPERYGALIRKGLLSVSPGFESLIQELSAEWRGTAKQVARGRWLDWKDGRVTGLDGRPIRIEKEHTILVYMLQSDEAIMMQYALCFLYKWLTEKGWEHGREYGFVANVHDEIQAEVRDDLAPEFAELGERAITVAGEFLRINCPHQGESAIGNNWYETH